MQQKQSEHGERGASGVSTGLTENVNKKPSNISFSAFYCAVLN